MAEDNFKRLLFGMIFLSLFTLLILMVVQVTTEDFGVSVSQLSQGAFNLTPYNDSLQDLNENAEQFRERFEAGSIWSAIAGVVVEGIFGIAKSMIILITLPFSFLGKFLTFLSVPSIIITVLQGVLVLSIIFGIWRLLKIGD